MFNVEFFCCINALTTASSFFIVLYLTHLIVSFLLTHYKNLLGSHKKACVKASALLRIRQKFM